jgi:ribosomal protein L29
MFEVDGVPMETAQEALRLGAQKLPVKCKFCRTPRLCRVMIEMTEIRQLSDSDLQERIEVEREALAKLRFNHTVAGLESTTALKVQEA